METKLRGRVHDLVLAARESLMSEARSLLEGEYGLHEDARLEPASGLPALRHDTEAQETRKRLETFLADEGKAGIKGREAVDKLVKEVAFTHLNRLVAFKMMEARKLIRGTLDKGADSNAFKLYLVEHPEDETLWKSGHVDDAYRHFLLWQCGQIAREVKVLFDPANLASRLFPRPRVFTDILGMLNDPEVIPAWVEDETIGWVYQYFNEREKGEVFDRLYKKKLKVRREDIPAATQLFTPRWIVKFLVQNTLGRIWVQMHPDTALVKTLDYLVPLAGEIPPVPLKPVGGITLLDPACGTMHFGLVAFDLYVEMYREELAHAGKTGWPEKPSVEREEDIPAAIIANNLFGIDIDLRAVQLSALTLYLKAKSLNKKAEITESHLACADVLLLNGQRLEEFLAEMAFTRPVYGRVIRAFWTHVKNTNQLGSLVRLEEEVRSLTEAERKAAAKEKQLLPAYRDQDRFADALASDETFWEILDEQIIQAFDDFARRQAERGADVGYFTGEATKGLRLLDIMLRRYDVLVANPPYMTARNMNEVMRAFLKTAYPRTRGDLYAAFIQRCAEFLHEAGRLGLITQQSFMFLSSYEDLRKGLLNTHAVEVMAHVGPRAFDEITGEKVNTTAYVARHEVDARQRDNAVGSYFRLVRGIDSEAKRLSLEAGIHGIRTGASHPGLFLCRQEDFNAIQGSPWVYWVRPRLRNLFRTLPGLGTVAATHCGMTTSDNFRFLRLWWEIGVGGIRFRAGNRDEAAASGRAWFPYMKGGVLQRWYGNQQHVVKWPLDGAEIRASASFPRAMEYYFRRGVTWTELTSRRFNARISPGGFIFDVKGSSAFPQDIPLFLALLNSSFAHYALKLINPTVSVQVGDVACLPIPQVSSDTVRPLVERAVTLARVTCEADETTHDCVEPLAWKTGIQDATRRAGELAAIEREIDENVYQLYCISAEDRTAIEAELPEQSGGAGDEASDDGSESGDDDVASEDAVLTKEELALRWIGYALGVAMGRFEPGKEDALGCGRFERGIARQLAALADSDGVLVVDPGHSDDIATRVWASLGTMLGEDDAAKAVEAATRRPGEPEGVLRAYFARDFLGLHLRQYRKRPIYWSLQSSRRSYGVVLFHEKVTRDTLFLILQRYLEPKITLEEGRRAELSARRDAAEGRERRKLDKDIETLGDLLDELREFRGEVEAVTRLVNERGETVGYAPDINDGVLINMSPLRAMVQDRAFARELGACWSKLEAGDYDWAHMAMHYWPDRVTAKCLTDKSLAIAHDRTDLYEGD